MNGLIKRYFSSWDSETRYVGTACLILSIFVVLSTFPIIIMLPVALAGILIVFDVIKLKSLNALLVVIPLATRMATWNYASGILFGYLIGGAVYFLAKWTLYRAQKSPGEMIKFSAFDAVALLLSVPPVSWIVLIQYSNHK